LRKTEQVLRVVLLAVTGERMQDKLVLAIDDGYFLPEYKSLKGYTPIVGVVGYRSFVLNIYLRLLLVDSMGIGKIFLEIYNEHAKANGPRIDAIMGDNVIYGGFSVYDPWDIYSNIGVPLIVIFSHELDLGRIRKALEKHFIDHHDRYRIIDKAYRLSRLLQTPRGILRILCVGIDWDRCIDIVIDNQTFHPLPQPLRHADIIASAVGRLISSNLSPIDRDSEHS
jgi:endonuclease V-like protein UPF0215 family